MKQLIMMITKLKSFTTLRSKKNIRSRMLSKCIHIQYSIAFMLLLFTRLSQTRYYGQHYNTYPSGQNKNYQFGIYENNDLFQSKKKIIQSGFQWKKNLLSSKYEFVKGLLRPKLQFKQNLIDTKLSFKRNIFNAKRRLIQPLFNKKVNFFTSLLQHKISFLRNIFG